MNERIRAPRVRLIDEEGKQAGIVETPEALRMAQEAELDLVEVAPDADPPVCRIMDHGKFLYEKRKKVKKAHTSTLKEIKVRPKISQHDFEFKSRHVARFLQHGDKVKLTLQFRGREMAHVEESAKLLFRMADEHKGYCQVEAPPAREGRRMIMILSPSGKVPKDAVKKAAPKPQKDIKKEAKKETAPPKAPEPVAIETPPEELEED